MNGTDTGRRLSTVGAVALIIVGIWLLLGRIDLPWWGAVVDAMRFMAELAWPLMLIGVGGVLLYAARSGGFAGVAAGERRIYRSRRHRMVAGVLGGAGAYLGIDPTWLRLPYALLLLSNPFLAVVAYVAAVIFIAEEPVEPTPAPQWPRTPQAPEPPE